MVLHIECYAPSIAALAELTGFKDSLETSGSHFVAKIAKRRAHDVENTLTPEQALGRLIFHAQGEAGSFLAMLRPYRGLRDDVLQDVMDALRACASKLAGEQLPRGLISALWAISHLGRLWALEPGGMLRRNQLISADDQSKLSAFLQRFDYAVMMLLEGESEEEAFDTDSGDGE